MNATTRQFCQAVYDSTFNAVGVLLEGRHSGGELLDGVALALRHVEGSVEGFRQMTGVEVACRAGCSLCCWLTIDARAHEVLLLARQVRRDFSPARLAAVQAEAGARRRARSETPPDAPPPARQPCVLLRDDGWCSVYEARPSGCRRYLSLSLAECRRLWEDDTAEAAPQHPLIAEAGRFAAGGMHNALVKAGFDGYYYDLPSALAEALEDPADCEARWLRREKVFSRSAETSTPGFSQDEAVARLKASLHVA